MAQLNSEEFEAAWRSCRSDPILGEAKVITIEFDLSLSGILDQYLTMADRFFAQGKMNAIGHEPLVAAVGALKLILDRSNDRDLVRQEMTNRAKAVEQPIQDQITNLALGNRNWVR
jgi:hypothetical protein